MELEEAPIFPSLIKYNKIIINPLVWHCVFKHEWMGTGSPIRPHNINKKQIYVIGTGCMRGEDEIAVGACVLVSLF